MQIDLDITEENEEPLTLLSTFQEVEEAIGTGWRGT